MTDEEILRRLHIIGKDKLEKLIDTMLRESGAFQVIADVMVEKEDKAAARARKRNAKDKK